MAVIFAMAASLGYAQTCKLTGQIVDPDNRPIDYATVAILAMDSTLVTATITSEAGTFTINLPEGEYLLTINALSFRGILRPIWVDKNVNVGTMTLEVETTLLDEVVVEGVRPSVKRNATGLVVSVENVKHLQDKTVDRILNYSPGVVIDKNGNISINGNGGVTVIVNDKTMHLSGDQLISYLKSIQGSDLRSIEIINNPTSAYSAEGSGGVVIINTRRHTEVGLTGYASANYSFDRRSSYRPAAGLAYSFEDFTLYGNYSYTDNRSAHKRIEANTYTESPQLTVTTDNTHNHDRSHNWRCGADWQISPRHFIGFEYNGQTNSDEKFGSSDLMILESGIIAQSILSSSTGLHRPHNNLFNFNYSWDIDSIGQKLKLVADYSSIVGMKTDDCFNNRYIDSAGTYLGNLHKRSLSNESTRLLTAQVDYDKPLGGMPWKLSGGLKYSHINIDYDYNLLSWKDYETPQADTRFTDRFRFTETLVAAYVNGAYNSAEFDANAGIRTEYTNRIGISHVNDTRNKKDDFRMFPSCFLYYKPGGTSGFMAYYGMRIQRPSYNLLDPFVVYQTDLSYKMGNPSLKPMISNVVELTYVLMQRYYLSLRANLSNDRIRDFSYTDGEYTVETFANISNSDMWYINAYIPLDLKKWTTSVLLNAGLIDTRAGDRKRRALTIDLSWDNYLQITDRLGFQANLSYTPPYKDVYQTFKEHIVKIDLCVDYSFGQGKWNLSVGVDDLLHTMNKRTVTLTYPDLTQHTTSWRLFGVRTAWATLKLNFSTSKRATRQRKDTSNQDEINRLQ